MQYFKPSGKFYSSGEFDVADDTDFYAAVAEVKVRKTTGTLPGLQSGWWHGPILIRVGENVVPHIIPPRSR